jgi:hypothetical protein
LGKAEPLTGDGASVLGSPDKPRSQVQPVFDAMAAGDRRSRGDGQGGQGAPGKHMSASYLASAPATAS